MLYQLPDPTTVRLQVIHGQLVPVLVYPTGARRKLVRAFPEAIDGTSEAALGTLGRKLLASSGANSSLRLARRMAASPTKLGATSIDGRAALGNGMRQSAYSAPLAPMRVSDGQFNGRGERSDLVVTAPGHDDDTERTLFGRCSAIATHPESPKTSFGMRGTYADGSRVFYHGQPIPEAQVGRTRPTRRVVTAGGTVQVSKRHRAGQLWAPRKRKPDADTYLETQQAAHCYDWAAFNR